MSTTVHEYAETSAEVSSRPTLEVVRDEPTSEPHVCELRYANTCRVPGVEGSRYMLYVCKCGKRERRAV